MTKFKEYEELVTFLIKKKNIAPNNGKKTDPAHPAIYPTGIMPRAFENEQEKIFDLIVRRFFLVRFQKHEA